MPMKILVGHHFRSGFLSLLSAGVVFISPGAPFSPATAATLTANRASERVFSPLFSRPVLAFYYTWYHPDTFCRCQMSDLPVARYDSSDVATIDRQIRQATQAGITGFITSWPGPGNTQDDNLAKLLLRAAVYQQKTGIHFVSSLYLESDADAVRNNLAGALRYAIKHYTADPHFFHWQGKPVIFIWRPIGNGRTLSTWSALRQQVDPGHRLLWLAEGTDTSLLRVFDGLHLFSAAYWGLLDHTIASVDQSFRTRINAYNSAHRTHKIWIAGVQPGYDDTRVPGRVGTYRVPRNSGTTYRLSWQGAISSAPDWISVSTFNEWFEGSMIEPSLRYGSLYLNLTRQFSGQWRRG